MTKRPASKSTVRKRSTSKRASTKPSASKRDEATTDSGVPFAQLYRDLPNRFSGGRHAPVLEFDGSFVDVDDRRIFVRATPNVGTPGVRQAVFVHGLGGSARNWTDLMYLLEPAVSIIAPDLPGFGRSPMPADRDYSQAAHAQTVIRLIEDQCDGPVDLFGNSMGGAISIRIAALRPDLVRSLTLVSPAVPDLRPRLSTAPLVAMTAPGIAELRERLQGRPDPEAAVDRMHRICFLDPTMVHEERRGVQIEETRWRLSRENSADPLRNSARGLGRAFLPGPNNVWTLAQQVNCPTLAIFGTDDKLVDPRMATPAAKHFHNARIVTLKTGHVAQMEVPVKVAELVLTMWAQMYA